MPIFINQYYLVTVQICSWKHFVVLKTIFLNKEGGGRSRKNLPGLENMGREMEWISIHQLQPNVLWIQVWIVQ